MSRRLCHVIVMAENIKLISLNISLKVDKFKTYRAVIELS